MRRVEFTDKAVEGLESLTTTIQERIFKKNRWLSDNIDEIRHQALSDNLNLELAITELYILLIMIL